MSSPTDQTHKSPPTLGGGAAGGGGGEAKWGTKEYPIVIDDGDDRPSKKKR